MAPPTLPQKRVTVSDKERFKIRKHAKDHPSTQAKLIEWFYQQSGHRLDQSQMSQILSHKYDYLDAAPKEAHVKDKLRTSVSDWPGLEAALFEWQQRAQKANLVITGEILKQQAERIWTALPQYQNQAQPKWSNGWLGGFKKRFNIREYVRHGEAASAHVNDPDNIQQMEKVRQLAAEYGEDNTFNMDETGLFWRLVPDRTLATKPGAGGTKSKDRVTLAFTCSASGECLQPWFIGKSKNPRCFRKTNRELFRIQYRFNKSKWMTGFIMQDYLRWLNRLMRGKGRRILLLLDNFSGHELGVELVGGVKGLSHVEIMWLPACTTSLWQPLDQGVIASFKVQYRRLWVHYMLRQYEQGKDALKTVDILKALMWSRAAWEGLSPDTIKRCWWKSTVFKKPEDLDQAQADDNAAVADLQAMISRIPQIVDPLPINEFISPAEEIIIEYKEQDIFQQVVEQYSIVEGDDIDEAEDAEVEEESVTVFKAIEALETLKLFETQQEDGSEGLLCALDQAGTRYLTKRDGMRKQVTLERYLKSV